MPIWTIALPPLLTAGMCAAGRTPQRIRLWSITGSVAALAVSGSMTMALYVGGFAPLRSSGMLWDALSSFLSVIISLLSLIASLSSGDFLDDEAMREKIGVHAWRTYFGLFHIFVSAMLLAAVSNNLCLLWVMIESTTLSSAFLVGFHRHRHSIEAAWKYVLLCSIGIAFALFGTILFYYASLRGGNGHSLDWTSFMGIAHRLDPKLVKLAFLFVALGYGTKAGLAPLHTWLPDAHSQAPSPVSALLSGVLLSTAFCGLARFYSITRACVGPQYPGAILVFFGVASLAIAMPFILAARDYKRMLAYSSVEHMGLLSFGLGVGSPQAVYGFSLHLLFHAFCKGIAFLSAGRILSSYGTRKINKVAGVLSSDPESGIPFFASALGLAGLPPFGIFTSEFILLSSGFASGRFWTSLLMLAFLTAIFSGFMYHAVQISFGNGSRMRDRGASRSIETGLDLAWVISSSLFLAGLVLFGLWIPGSLNRWIMEIVRVIQGNPHV